MSDYRNPRGSPKGAGKNIRVLRRMREMSQSDLAKLAGVTRFEVIQWEQGKYLPNEDAVDRLMEVFGVERNVVYGKTVLHYESANIRWVGSQPRKSGTYLSYVRRTNGQYEYALLDYDHDRDRWEEKDTTYVNLLTGARVAGYRELDGEVLQWSSFPPCDADINEQVARVRGRKR